MTRAATILAASALALTARAGLLPRERAAIEGGLAVAGLRESDLDALRPVPGANAPELARRLAREPLTALDELLDLAPNPEESPADALDALRRRAFGDGAIPPPRIEPVPVPESVPAPLRGGVARLVGALVWANAEVRASLAKLTPDERRTLIEGLPAWAGRRAGLRPDFAKESAADDPRALFALLAKVDAPRLRRAGIALARETDAAVPALKAAAGSVGATRPLRLILAGVTVEIMGTDPDDHPSRDAALSLDLGGANRYTGRAGAGIGYAAVMVDLGSAAFDVPDAAAGCGLLGLGIARVEGGATGRSGLLAFGAGIAGVGSLAVGGRADLESRALAQGYGLAGLGLLRTGAGRDALRLGAYGQGCGFANGLGALADLGGDDIRQCPGLAPGEDLRDPPSERESCAQGYGEGGVGLLLDRAGDDRDEIGSRGQGSGDAGGVGLLLDAEGDDLRRAARFAQGYGASGGAGLLLDLAGGDANLALRGDAHGCAEENGLGVALDRAGDDATVGGFAGVATGGGIGLFLDGAGRDEVAARTRPLATDGSLSLSLILGEDARGLDLPPPGGYRPNPGWSAGALLPSVPADAVAEGPPPGSLNPDPARIARAVGLLASRRGALRSGAVRELVAYGRPGLEAALAGLEAFDPARDLGAIEAIGAVVRALGDPGARAVAPLLAKPTRNALLLAAAARLPVDPEALTAALDDDARRPAALEAVAAAGDPSLAPAVLPLLLSDDRPTARAAARALLRVGGEAEAASVRSLVATADPALRRLVVAFLARFPASEEWAKGLLTDPDPARAGAAIELLGEIGTPEALRLAGTGLNAGEGASGRPLVLAALRALAGRVPEAWRGRVLELQNSPDPLISGAARGVDLGR